MNLDIPEKYDKSYDENGIYHEDKNLSKIENLICQKICSFKDDAYRDIAIENLLYSLYEMESKNLLDKESIDEYKEKIHELLHKYLILDMEFMNEASNLRHKMDMKAEVKSIKDKAAKKGIIL